MSYLMTLSMTRLYSVGHTDCIITELWWSAIGRAKLKY